MRCHFKLTGILQVLVLAGVAIQPLSAQSPLGTAFTYQGQLKSGGSPANGSFTMVFKLWNDPVSTAPGNQVGPTLTFDGVGIHPPQVSIANGLFTVQLDFQSAFNGDKRWLEITVSGTTLSPRQELTASPYSQFSAAPWRTSGANISTTNAGNVGIGTAAPAQKLSVNGVIESTSGGFKFPDGTSQTSAAASLPFSSTSVLSAWGQDYSGQTDAPSGSFTQVAGGFSHSLAIRSDGTLAGWGSNFSGQITVPSGTFTALAAGGDFGLAIRNDGTLAGWGYNGDGEINVPSGTFTAVAAGWYHSLGLRTDGTLIAWGDNGYGQLSVPSGTFTAIAAGGSHCIAIRSNGTLATWGDNGDLEANMPAGTYIAVASGAYHNLGIKTDGTLAAAGYNGYNQNNIPAGTFTKIADGYGHCLAIRTDGTLAGWGDDSSGQIDVPSRTCTAIAAGDSHSIGVFSGISLTGALAAGATTIDGSLSVDGSISASGGASLTGPVICRNNVQVDGRLGVDVSYPQSSLDVGGSIRARQGTPGFGGIDNNGFSFGFPSDESTGMYSSANGQLEFYSGNSEIMRVATNGFVGIGTTAPATKLHIVGGSDTSLAGGGYIQLGQTTSSNISIDDNEIMARANGAVSGLFLNHEGGNVIMADLGAGNLGIGTSNPAQRLHVIGNICATGTIGACSDGRFKKNVKPVDGALAAVEKLQGVRFDWKRDEFADHQFAEGRQLGFVAQEVEKVLPEVVAKGSDGYLSVDYGRLTPVLVEAVKELRKENESLKAELAEIRKMIARSNPQGGK